MITMINERNGHQTRFKNYKRLYSHLNSHQWVRRRNSPHHLIDDWFFACHSYRRVMAFHKFIHSQKIDSGSDVLEISYGLSSKPLMVPVTPELDIESLIEVWCQKYCDAHGYKLVEVYEDDGFLRVRNNRVDLSNPGLTHGDGNSFVSSELMMRP